MAEKYIGHILREDIKATNLTVTPRLTTAASFISGDTYRRFVADRALHGDPKHDWRINFAGDVRELMTRATYNASTDGLTSLDHRGPLGGGPGRTMYLQDLLLQGTTNSDSVIYGREIAAWTNEADAVAAGDEFAQQALDLEEVTARVTNAAVFLRTTDETLADYKNLESFINNRLVRRVKLKIESLLINSNGISPSYMIGFMEAGLPTVSVATAGSMLEALQESIALVESNGFTPSFIVLNPTDLRALYSEAADTPLLIWDNNGVRRFAGIPIIGSTAITAGTGLIGDGSEATIMYREGISGSAYRTESTNKNEDDFLNGLVTIRSKARAALVIQSLGAFVEITA